MIIRIQEKEWAAFRIFFSHVGTTSILILLRREVAKGKECMFFNSNEGLGGNWGSEISLAMADSKKAADKQHWARDSKQPLGPRPQRCVRKHFPLISFLSQWKIQLITKWKYCWIGFIWMATRWDMIYSLKKVRTALRDCNIHSGLFRYSSKFK